MTDSKPLWQWDAQEIASATRAGKLSAVEATEAAIARMEEVNPALNAVVETLADEARAVCHVLQCTSRPLIVGKSRFGPEPPVNSIGS